MASDEYKSSINEIYCRNSIAKSLDRLATATENISESLHRLTHYDEHGNAYIVARPEMLELVYEHIPGSDPDYEQFQLVSQPTESGTKRGAAGHEDAQSETD